MLRLQGTVVECVTSCMVIVLEGCGFNAAGKSKRLNGDWSPLLFELVARTKLSFCRHSFSRLLSTIGQIFSDFMNKFSVLKFGVGWLASGTSTKFYGAYVISIF